MVKTNVFRVRYNPADKDCVWYGDGDEDDKSVSGNHSLSVASKPPAKKKPIAKGVNRQEDSIARKPPAKEKSNAKREAPSEGNPKTKKSKNADSDESAMDEADPVDSEVCSLVCLKCRVQILGKIQARPKIPRDTTTNDKELTSQGLDYTSQQFEDLYKKAKNEKSDQWHGLQKWVSLLRTHYCNIHPGEKFPCPILFSKNFLGTAATVEAFNKTYDGTVNPQTFAKWFK